MVLGWRVGWAGYCCCRIDREVIIWGMEGGGCSICLLPLLIGTSASQTATDAEAHRERWRAMVLLGVDASCQVVAGRFSTSVVFKYISCLCWHFIADHF